MRAMIAREREHLPAHDRRIVDGGRTQRQRGEREPDERSALHQSSFTAATASAVIALRPLATAVSVASATTAIANQASCA